ncbi:type II secretion system F family protein [Candidatus Aerophobetes bacterium]|uniref:Type II secretion system F family protein n=1 Tax=Aerophobetes bacterium TaxID=2030807 RepID=A0A523RYY6_UNCAE|nr:MAG: type II secretion system F family protein [Candidatus Aerophobetes bacterium]
MATYTYEICNELGKTKKGSLKAESEEVAISRLKDSSSYIISLKEGKQSVLPSKPTQVSWLDQIRPKDLVIFNRQLATMIGSGLSLDRSLSVLSRQTESKKLGSTLKEVVADIEKGASFSQALAKFPKVFSHLYISMIRAGEVGGILQDVLDRLALLLEKEEKIRRDVKAATLYPKLLISIAIGGAAFLVIFVLPSFLDMFTQLEVPLPLPTKILIALITLLTTKKYLMAGVSLSLVIGFLAYVRTEAGKFNYDLLKIKLPIIGNLVSKVIISRCCRILGILYSSGVPLLEALEVVKEVADNRVVAKTMTQVRQNVEEGRSIAQPLEESKVFPPMTAYMIRAGEETGALDTMLAKISDFYDEEVESTVRSLSSIIEPLLLGVIALIVGFVAISIFFPMFDMINAVKIK